MFCACSVEFVTKTVWYGLLPFRHVTDTVWYGLSPFRHVTDTNSLVWAIAIPSCYRYSLLWVIVRHVTETNKFDVGYRHSVMLSIQSMIPFPLPVFECCVSLGWRQPPFSRFGFERILLQNL